MPCSLQTQNVQLNKEMTLASNRSLAEGNLLYQPQLDALKARLTQKYQELQVLFEAYQIKKTKLGNFSRVILARIKSGGKGTFASCWAAGRAALLWESFRRRPWLVPQRKRTYRIILPV